MFENKVHKKVFGLEKNDSSEKLRVLSNQTLAFFAQVMSPYQDREIQEAGARGGTVR
jgi:hypothetical protein